MFLRRYRRTKDGKVHSYFALVESLRTAAGPRQRVVAQLGELNANEERRWQRTVVFHNRQGDAEQLRLFPDDGTLFQLEYDLLLYDLTSSYFEGLAEDNDLAQRGYSRDHRSDCKQIVSALIVTRDGFPLAHQTFAGNTRDLSTVKHIKILEAVGRLQERFPKAHPFVTIRVGATHREFTYAWNGA